MIARRTNTSGVLTALVGLAWCGLVAGCSTAGEQPSEQVDDSVPTLSCKMDRADTVELFRSGLPDYDYDPAADLAHLVERSEVVVRGSVSSVTRRGVGNDRKQPDTGNSWTTIAVIDQTVLHGPADAEEALTSISTSSFWPVGAEPDPWTSSVGVEGMSFIAFLNRFDSAPEGYAVDVQGLVVACSTGDEPAIAVIEPLPVDASGLTISDLSDRIRAISNALAMAALVGVDGPVMRHLERTSEGQDAPQAEIRGRLEIDGNCLYISDGSTGRRYPIVWPQATWWDEDSRAVVTPDGKSLDSIGITDPVAGTGAYVAVEMVEQVAGPEAAALAQDCVNERDGEVIIVNNSDVAITRTD